MSEAGWLALAAIIAGLVKQYFDMKQLSLKVDGVHSLVNSEMTKSREELVKRLDTVSELAYARGFEEGGRVARHISADTLVAAAKALPSVVVPTNTEPLKTKGGGWVMEGPNENPMARKK